MHWKDLLSRLPGLLIPAGPNTGRLLIDEEQYYHAAVLLPLLRYDSGEPAVLFEVRAAELNRQPGEVCFPGGRLEPGEPPHLAARRETCEELGIAPEQVEILGELGRLVIPYGILLHPYVGIIHTADLRPARQEVAEVFTVPLQHLAENPPGISRFEVATRYAADFPFHRIPSTYGTGWQKRAAFPMYYFTYRDYFIWGFTAKILFHFCQLLWPAHPVYSRRS
ncbi:MAG: NUDIX hydrolase [Desulfurispora sp.]|uniref:NUDIX hydrolase n=1 Tax=Desulfurispora sp. TaxID=3014275 RepID=UPI00404A12A6